MVGENAHGAADLDGWSAHGEAITRAPELADS
jgi:hypothetical protein